MRSSIQRFVLAFLFSASGIALADNTLTNDQLIKSIQAAVADYSTNVDPEMAKSISGLRTTTVGMNANVTIEMNADGMKMSIKYLCAPQGPAMVCNIQP